jgi:hypothetical protein
MLIFSARVSGDDTTPGVELEFILTRTADNTYALSFGRAYGMAASRRWAGLNSTTSPSEPLILSTDKRPCIWVDSSLDRDPRNLGPKGGVIATLLSCTPPVFRLTGEKKNMYAKEGGWREAQQVEILLKEEHIAHSCHCCGNSELPSRVEGRYTCVEGEDYISIYRCSDVS